VKKYLTLLFIFFLGINLILVGCKGKNQDTKDIEDIISNSLFTNQDQSQAFEDNDTVPEEGLMLAMPDTMTVPWIKFVRKITSFTRHISVEVNDTIATATIGTSFTGNFMVINDRQNPTRYLRPINDTGIRTIYLTKSDGHWRIHKISPDDIRTRGANPEITIVSLRAEASPSGSIFEITNPETLLTKTQLPTFYPDDTVKLTVTIQVPNDSAWVFLHRGRTRPFRKRDPFLRINTYTFERTWIIGTDADISYTTPVVRPTATDAILWQTLWGDSSAPYNCRAWALPYVVKRSNEPYPDSE
jgi:hypothetical protein